MNTKLKRIISIPCVIALILSFSVSAFATQTRGMTNYNNGLIDVNYNSDIKNPKYVTPVGHQGDEDECMFYAVTSAAGSYCLKNNIVSGSKANFSATKLVKKIGASTNYGKVLYGSATTSLGSGCYITGIENLTGKGIISLKQQIKAKGSVIAAINLPTGGMVDIDYYSSKNATYNYNFSEKQADIYHAFVIVGWDDEFSKDNFIETPAENGAWLCKNSYGTDYGKGGYFWLPYSYPLTYAASVEVSKFYGMVMLKNSSASVKPGYVAAVSFISSESIADAHVTLLSGKEVVLDTNSDVNNGFNFVSLDKPVKADDITVKVADKDIAVFAKYVVVNKNKVLKPSTVEVTSEIKVLENVSINIGETYAYAVTNGEIEHNVYLNAFNNCYYITPCDGYSFNDETEIDITQIYINSDEKKESSHFEDVAWYIPNVALMPNGSFEVVSGTEGGAYVKGLDIITGENGQINDVYLMFDGGQRQLLGSTDYTVKLYTDSTKTTSVTDVADLDTYYAEITVNSYIAAEKFNVYVNGVLASGSSTGSDAGVTIGAQIEIPDVSLSGHGIDYLIWSFILIFSGLFR